MTETEQEIRRRLDAALGAVSPSPAPVEAVIRHGRSLRRRRQAVLAAGLAAVAVAAIAVPTLLSQWPPASPPVTPRPPAVTVNPPGPGAPAGLIASGTVGTRRWSARVNRPKNGQACLSLGLIPECAVSTSTGGEPGNFAGIGVNGYLVEAGPASRQVTRFTVQLTDGQRLTLRPVRWYGSRWVAFPVPRGAGITRVTAWAGPRVLRYAVPFNGPRGGPWLTAIVAWLRPGDPGLPRHYTRIDPAAGDQWFVGEYAGPWGLCFVMSSNSSCLPIRGPVAPASQLTQGVLQTGEGRYIDAAATRVASVRITLSSGRVIQPPLRAGTGAKFYAFALARGTRAVRWTAYGADGSVLGSGAGDAGGG